jgi:hypothetical protein
MTSRVFKLVSESIRSNPSYEDRWHGADKGLIICWEVGREKRESDLSLVAKVERNELPVLGWKGGVVKALKNTEKFGSLNYLAQWQGIRGEDLDIDLAKEISLKCSKTGMIVTYTPHVFKYNQ